MPNGSEPTTGKRIAYSVLIGAGVVVVIFVIAESIAQRFAPTLKRTGSYENVGHRILGWTPKPESSGTESSPEFSAKYEINAVGLHDDPIDLFAKAELRITALGDSHTFALGVDTHQAWPNVLERLLFDGDHNRGTVFNLGVVGYSLGQYVQRLKLLKDLLRPDIVLVGFSMATDLYDLIPPRMGGFVYEANRHRVYYDLNRMGELVERNSAEGEESKFKGQLRKDDYGLKIRGVLQNLALYRALRRTSLATWIAVNFHPAGISLWPGLETALKTDLNADELYRWHLAEAILADLATYASDNELMLVIVNIPYLAQVYDEVWESSFGRKPNVYDRWVGGKRLAKICEKLNVGYIDTTKELVRRSRQNHTWLHYKQDGHPTPRGQALIARSVHRGLIESGLVTHPSQAHITDR